MIFPFACREFKIHLENTITGKTAVIDDSAKDIIEASDSLITFCDASSKYNDYLNGFHDLFDMDRYYKKITVDIPKSECPVKQNLNKKEMAIRRNISMTNNNGKIKEYDLVIEGWISTYASSKDKKKGTDFPVNHISIISNDKLGQLDILPDITTDRMQEAYVVGQFFVDLLEETELPDIAASNRQGYKEDDERVIQTKDSIKTDALKPILDLKKKATQEKNYLKDLEKDKQNIISKRKFDESINKIIEDPEFKKVIKSSKNIKETLEESWQLKDILTESYRKVMISHDSQDKEIINELEKILLFCGFRKDEIIYTSSDNYESGITGAYTNIYDFLQEFFVNTTKKNDISVIYILNQNFIHKWNPVLEAGAGWVLDSKRFPIFTDNISSVLSPFKGTDMTPCLKYGMNNKDVHYLVDAICQICNNANKKEKEKEEIIKYIYSSTRLT